MFKFYQIRIVYLPLLVHFFPFQIYVLSDAMDECSPSISTVSFLFISISMNIRMGWIFCMRELCGVFWARYVDIIIAILSEISINIYVFHLPCTMYETVSSIFYFIFHYVCRILSLSTSKAFGKWTKISRNIL